MVKTEIGKDRGDFYQNRMSAAIPSKPNLCKIGGKPHAGKGVSITI